MLRHWNDVGVVVPDRTPTGHREYTDEHIARLRIVQACQRVGMSLPEVRLILTRSEARRSEVIERRLEWIRAQRAQLADAERFLTHVIECRHDLVTRCEDCAQYSALVPRFASRP
ncbi:hypothetical protein GCM10017576_08330 [Microbacterium barkeri]|uniref:HTH merR-type domain-containing protein n=1 Tax=Microbacterium barkeri TaxID=33917 RepID=A0A9W6H233_9MICO|nr:MerR family transcriptional regulator [Microbacterium barkeri]MDI6942704.1 MerR family transcriptional regulator [Microbacterium barkeri]GLJ60704.1 hypothetical protein GCM10017576_08330 [Microbacterium barkeri]